MGTVHVTIDATLTEVWETLIDVRTYPRWLIGALRIRDVDAGWPAPGTAFHHEVGLGGPFRIADRTRSVAVVPLQRLVLDVRALPIVHGKVTFELQKLGGGTEVAMEEHPIGLFRLLAPLIAPITQLRNRASLRQLEARVHRLGGVPVPGVGVEPTQPRGARGV